MRRGAHTLAGHCDLTGWREDRWAKIWRTQEQVRPSPEDRTQAGSWLKRWFELGTVVGAKHGYVDGWLAVVGRDEIRAWKQAILGDERGPGAVKIPGTYTGPI